MANKKDRFFILWFSGLEDDGALRKGKIIIKAMNGHFVNELSAVAIIEEKHKLDEIFIRNILEISEADFNDFIDGNDEDPNQELSFKGFE